jgi:glycosidase
MNHPGPPQFMAVGETVQVAPRDPDPDAEYHWRVKSAPVSSQLSLGDDPVVDFTPDAAGTFVLELTGPLGIDELTIRVFSGELAPGGRGAGSSGASGQSGMSGVSGVSGVSGSSGISGASGSGSGARGAEKEGVGGGRPRVTLHGRVEEDTVVIEADPQPNPNSSTPREELSVEFLVDDRWPVDGSNVTVDGWTLTMPVDAFEEKTRVHAVSIDAEYSVADAIEIRVKGTTVDFGEGARTDGGTAVQGGGTKQVETGRLYEPPEWSKDITLYEIYVRGFASDDDEAENTFAALEKRLDYLEGLGVDCLWLTPVLQNDHAPHGYNIVDFYEVAEDLGDMDSYEAFVDAAHDHGMKVMFDLVLNHSAREHPYFKDAYKNPDSAYYDWYEWQENGEPGTYFDWEYIANFDYHSLEVRRYLLDAVQQWFEIVDGFRCDMAWAVPFTFWQELRDRVKSQDPDFLLLDETIPYIADFHEGMFDMHFDTTLYFTLRQVGDGHQPADAILDAIEQRTEVGFPDHASFMLYQENHDETRYIVECGDEAAFASAGALFTLPGVPMLYGGQEIGQRGRRDALAWDDAREEVQEHYEHLIEMRSGTPALDFRGGIDRVDYEADSEQVTVFRREAEGQSVIVVLNFGDAPEYVEVDAEVDGTNLVSGEHVVDDGTVAVESVAVLEER